MIAISFPDEEAFLNSAIILSSILSLYSIRSTRIGVYPHSRVAFSIPLKYASSILILNMKVLA